MSSSNFDQGEIVVAPIPFSGFSDAKTRPALVLTPAAYNRKSEDVIVLKVTSHVKDYPFDVNLRAIDLTSGALKQESVVQVDFPVVIDKASITQIIGRITPKKLQEVKRKIKELYGL
ncbi:MAG: type II toxin-antitoxin system PemK/MazF family toxin [Candidatus Diapherotrites archaeon]|nr:type II toxin-antitoxin system PemK/MazF family toxin [Candidatus Diapherotrites archaeon]